MQDTVSFKPLSFGMVKQQNSGILKKSNSGMSRIRKMGFSMKLDVQSICN